MTTQDEYRTLKSLSQQSAHPVALFFLFFFRIAAIVVYLLCGFFTSNYVLSVCCTYRPWNVESYALAQTVIVVILLAMDFWNCRVSIEYHHTSQ